LQGPEFFLHDLIQKPCWIGKFLLHD
jgi:hypothetical protein